MKKYCSILLFLLVCASRVAAVSAFPKPVTLTQPDGSSVTVIQRGDEHLHWLETTDGITLMRNSKGYLTYATTDASGNMIASDVVAQNAGERPEKVKSMLSSGARKVFFGQLQLDSITAKRKAALTERLKSAAQPTGTVKILVVMMNFSDLACVKTTTDFDNLFNEAGYSLNNNKSSVKEFFAANAYGNFAMNFDVKGPYTASRNRAYYGKDVGGTGYDQHPDSLVAEAIRAIHTENPSFDFSVYAAIDVVFAGNGQEFTGVTTDAIWSHQADFTPPSYCSITHYLCTPELYASTSNVTCTMGVLCHELNHVIGAPDYYDTNYNDVKDGEFIGMGEWDLMADGSWSYVGTNYYGTCPPNLTLYQKYRYGWITPTVLYSPTSVSNMTPSYNKGEAYIVKTPTRGEYYFLENRQQNGYDASIPGHGLLIYHIAKYADDIFYDLNITSPQMVYPVYAAATTDPLTSGSTDALVASYGSINTGACPFPGTAGVSSLTDNTVPSMKTWAKATTGKPITEISENTGNGTISFECMKGIDVAPAPTGITSKISGVDCVLSWTAPSVPQIADSIAEMHWDGPSLEYALGTGSKATLACAQVYGTSALSSYIGKKWTGVKFFPIDNNASSYSIQLYEYNTISGLMVSKLSQAITGITAGQWNEFFFTSPYTLESNKIYAIGVQYTSSQGYTVSVDRGAKIESSTNYNYGAIIIQNNTPYTIGSDNNYNLNVRGLISINPLVSYNIYQDGVKVGNTSSLAYTVEAGKTASYCVKTVNNGVEGVNSACTDYAAPAYTEPYIYSNNTLVYVYGVSEGTKVYVYSALGQLMREDISTGSPYTFTLPTGVWIIKTESLTKKVIIR